MSSDTKTFSNPETPGYVGFANLPNQVHRKSVKKGFEFTLMVVGESGLGKSTLVNSLFLTDLYPERNVPDASGEFRNDALVVQTRLWIIIRNVRAKEWERLKQASELIMGQFHTSPHHMLTAHEYRNSLGP
ncbi:hypothetical protein V5799_025906 [Amblyomma americanum]|uniref:Septin-type G domain-containing protein n=1 Tax=Amblyomma americanum TaxID=6943 RepID=A0AAQ4DK35_AMBAM